MERKRQMTTKTKASDSETRELLTTIETLGKSLWSIVVRQYLVKGVGELFIAIALLVAAYELRSGIGYWALIPVAVAKLFIWDAIRLIGNPKYFALQDAISRIDHFKDTTERKKVLKQHGTCIRY